MAGARLLGAALIGLVLLMGCAGGPNDSKTKKGAMTGAAVGAGVGLLVGALTGDTEIVVAAAAVGAASGALHGGYEGWRQDQEDERTRELAAAIRASGGAAQPAANLDAEARQREELTRFLGVWRMSGWVQEPVEARRQVTAQVNGDPHMNYFVQMAYVDLRVEGFEGQIWGTSTLGYDADSGFSVSTLADNLEISGGTFDRAGRSFVFTSAAGATAIRFETPDRFTVSTTVRVNGSEQTLESYRFTRM